MEPAITELFRRMKLPVFDGVVEALEKHSVLRKRALAKAKTTPEKRKRIALKKKRVIEGMERIKCTKNMAMILNFNVPSNPTYCEVVNRLWTHSHDSLIIQH